MKVFIHIKLISIKNGTFNALKCTISMYLVHCTIKHIFVQEHKNRTEKSFSVSIFFTEVWSLLEKRGQ